MCALRTATGVVGPYILRKTTPFSASLRVRSMATMGAMEMAGQTSDSFQRYIDVSAYTNPPKTGLRTPSPIRVASNPPLPYQVDWD